MIALVKYQWANGVDDGWVGHGGPRSMEHVLRRRLALVLTQRGANWNSSSAGDTGEMGSCWEFTIFHHF